MTKRKEKGQIMTKRKEKDRLWKNMIIKSTRKKDASIISMWEVVIYLMKMHS